MGGGVWPEVLSSIVYMILSNLQIFRGGGKVGDGEVGFVGGVFD